MSELRFVDPDYLVVIDPDSGTYFSAKKACLIDTRSLTEEQLNILNNGSDSEIGDLVCEAPCWSLKDLVVSEISRDEPV